MIRSAQGGTPPMVEKPKDVGIISLDKVIAHYDIKSAILRELAKVAKGKLISEAELCQRAAASDRNRFRRCVENNTELFQAMRIKLRLDEGEPKWWWGHAEDVAEAQKIRDI
jgi:hypothetical protein